MDERTTPGAPKEGWHPLKLKAILLSDDGGKTWLLARQYYLTCGMVSDPGRDEVGRRAADFLSRKARRRCPRRTA